MGLKRDKQFNKYNRKEDVIRCPNGRAVVRKLLSIYVNGFLKINGLVPKELIVQTFNEQTPRKTDIKEMYLLLLPWVFKYDSFYFYKEYIVSNIINFDTNVIDNLIREKETKPYYIPTKEEIFELEFINPIDNELMGELFNFLVTMDRKNFRNDLYLEIAYGIVFDSGLRQALDAMNNYNMEFSSEKQVEEFIALYQEVNNNTRKWKNNGFTPKELMELPNQQMKNTVSKEAIQSKIARNKPCPCGSGKKYIHCCALKEEIKQREMSENACLSEEDSILFYETWYGLLNYVNLKKRVIGSKIYTKYPKANKNSDQKLYPVREALWEEPEIIDEYIKMGNLSEEQKEILKLWQTNRIDAVATLYKHENKYSLFLTEDKRNVSSEDEGKDVVLAVKGMSNAIADIVKHPLPVPVYMIFLPFKGMIVYDTYIANFPINLSGNVLKVFNETYEKSLKEGIVTSLD